VLFSNAALRLRRPESSGAYSVWKWDAVALFAQIVNTNASVPVYLYTVTSLTFEFVYFSFIVSALCM
jgi:hypothetical protein